MSRFIIPNFHVILIHFPLAFFGFGLFIELCSFLWEKSSLHQAGRWMILLGTLAMMPAVTSGMYALFDVVGHGQQASSGWTDLKQSSGFSDADWQQAKDHVLLTAIAAGIAMVACITWLGGTELWRRAFYIPTLVALIVAMVLLTMGAWHGGEMIFRQGFGVQGLHSVVSSADATTQPTAQERIEAFFPALQMHLIMAGLVVAVSAGALGTAFRRVAIVEDLEEREEMQRRLGVPPDPTEPVMAPPPTQAAALEVAPVAPAPAEAETPPVIAPLNLPIPSRDLIAIPSCLPVARLWILAGVLAAATIFAGLYFAGNLAWPNVLNLPGLSDDLKSIQTGGERRTALHIVFGASILLLLAALAVLGRLTPRHRLALGIVSGALMLVIAAQIWIGILLLYDGGEGPLMHFK